MFPNSQTSGTAYQTLLGTKYLFDGVAWQLDSTSLGSTGLQGITGLVGSTGVQGGTGVGVQGDTGIQGTTGAGIQGATGTLGIDGATGLQGATGAGIQGATGVGTQGVTGLQGQTGVRGMTGIQGVTGLGVTGLQGPTGVGFTGIQGTTGPSGGPVGQTGIQGVTGVPGGSVASDGTTAYIVDLATINQYMVPAAYGSLYFGNSSNYINNGLIVKTMGSDRWDRFQDWTSTNPSKLVTADRTGLKIQAGGDGTYKLSAGAHVEYGSSGQRGYLWPFVDGTRIPGALGIIAQPASNSPQGMCTESIVGLRTDQSVDLRLSWNANSTVKWQNLWLNIVRIGR